MNIDKIGEQICMASGGDSDAYWLVYLYYSKEMVNHLKRRGIQEHDAWDIYSDAYEKTWEKPSYFNEDCS